MYNTVVLHIHWREYFTHTTPDFIMEGGNQAQYIIV